MKPAASKKRSRKVADLPETDLRRYDWSKARRGTYAARAQKASGLIRILDEDLGKDFPDSSSVNEALRALKALLAIKLRRAA